MNRGKPNVTVLTGDALTAFCGSGTRVATLGVLANSEEPLTGYRVAKLAGLQPIKVYRELDKANKSGLVQKTARGYRLVDSDIRSLLRKRIRVSWFQSWYDQESARRNRARAIRESSTDWFDSSRYLPNPSIANRYATEIERPREKDSWAPSRNRTASRKRA